MNTEEIARVVADQRAYFKTHATFDVDAARACTPATSPMLLACARRKPCLMASR